MTEIDAIDRLDDAISMLRGWGILLGSTGALSALGNSQCGPDAVAYSLRDIAERLDGVRDGLVKDGRPLTTPTFDAD